MADLVARALVKSGCQGWGLPSIAFIKVTVLDFDFVHHFIPGAVRHPLSKTPQAPASTDGMSQSIPGLWMKFGFENETARHQEPPGI